MVTLRNTAILYCIIFCSGIGISSLYAQKSIYYKERWVMGSTGLQNGKNPVFLQELQDSILFTTQATYTLDKGNFINYFEPDNSYTMQANTESYNRLSSRLVVSGSASYSFHKGKNVRGSSFLHPYKTPFNFVEKEENVRGDRRIERYHLVGGISYRLTSQLTLGGRIDHQSINFAKLKDMRNLNDILDLKADAGISYHISDHNTTGFSYRYKRYIEGFQPLKKGKAQKDYYALINRGSFMGLMHLYGESGILDRYDKKPWVAIAHRLSFQHQFRPSSDFKSFIEVNYENEKGHFGEEGNVSVMYFKHHRKSYGGFVKLVQKGAKKSHIFSAKGAYEKLQNNENLYEITTSQGGFTQVTYYGENEIFERIQKTFSLRYHFLFGENYTKAPWHLAISYDYTQRKSKTSYFPYFRKQEMSWHIGKIGITRLFHIKKTDFAIHLTSGFLTGNGGEPIDGTFVNAESSKPDYMNDLLYKEKEYLTANRLLGEAKLRVEPIWKYKTRLFLASTITYKKPFNLEYLTGEYLSLKLSVGLIF